MFNVTVERRKKDGTLKYSGGSVTVNTTCWWDPQRKIPAGIYYGCFATHMSEKKNSQGGPREGIWFPEVPGFSEIFIHMGSSPIWSDGCIVIREEEMLRMWNDIKPKDAANVTVTVRG